MSVLLNSTAFGNGRGSIILDKVDGTRQVITPVGDTQLIVAGTSVRGSVAGMINSINAPPQMGTSFGSYGFIGGSSFPPPAPSVTFANQSITQRGGLPITVPGVAVIQTQTLGGTVMGGRISSGIQNTVPFVSPITAQAIGRNILTSGRAGITTQINDQLMLASVQQSAFGQRLNTIAPAINSNILPALQPNMLIDADPITPGIQSLPGTVQITGPTTVIGNSFSGNSAIQTGNVFIDADPITPGTQRQAGVITATGPSVVVAKVSDDRCGGICWWLLPLLGLLLLVGLLSGLYHCFKPTSKINQNNQNNEQLNSTQNKIFKCEKDSFLVKGKCITCPTGSKWDGKSCTYQAQKQKQITTKLTVDAIQDTTSKGNNLSQSIELKSSSNSQNTQTLVKKVDVFDKQNLVRSQLSAPQSQGVAPQIVSTKPFASKPSMVVQNKAGSNESSSEYTSTNIINVAPIVQRKSVPLKFTYRIVHRSTFGHKDHKHV